MECKYGVGEKSGWDSNAKDLLVGEVFPLGSDVIRLS